MKSKRKTEVPLAARHVRHGRVRGFTLIELVMVMVMLGVLAVFAAPRIFNGDAFAARGLHDETLALLRFAHKTAIAQRRTVCVTFPSSFVAELAIAAAPSTVNCNAAAALAGPNGAPLIVAAVGATFSAATPPVAFNFDGLGQPFTEVAGQPVAMATQHIQIDNVSDVVVEASTGYVHD